MGTQIPYVAVLTISNKNRSVYCYSDTDASSAGIWLGDKPLAFSLPLLMAQFSLVILVTSICHFFLRRLGQPRALSLIVGGVFLGSSVAGRSTSFGRTMFPAKSWIPLNIIGELGLMIFMFMVGVKTDIKMLKKSGKKAVAIGFLSTLLPCSLTLALGVTMKNRMPVKINGTFFQLAANLGRTSYAVLSCLLDELNLLNSKVGRLAMSATLVAEFVSTVLDAGGTSIQLFNGASNRFMGLGSFMSFVCLLVFILYVARPLTLWMVRRTPEGEQMDDGDFVVVLAVNLLCGLVSEIIGHHAVTGCFVLGLALPSGPPLGSTLQARFEALIQGIFVPLFLASAGFRSNFLAIHNAEFVRWVLLYVFLGSAAKITGIVVPCYYCKVPVRDTAAVVLMMLTKGIYEVYVINSLMDTGAIDQETYALIVLCILGFTAVTTPILRVVYRPSRRYISHKRRTLEHARRDGELRLLVCLHNQDHVAPVVDLLNAFYASKQSPICIYALHITQISGHAAATLGPYEKNVSTESDHIVKALKFFEQESNGSLKLQPFVAISPPTTMYDDVCTMALEKKVALVILPFHKHMAVDGTMEALGALKTMNLNVLSFVPCSVGILVDHGASTGTQFVPTKHLLHRIALYFLGGADDREALACVSRMAENTAIGVTVVHFRLPADRWSPGPEDAIDDEIVSRFRRRASEEHSRLAYIEEIVKDGEDTMGIIRSVSESYSLLVVGRRHGVESPMTEGLSTWSEYPELGVLGDLLASTDFGANVSTLVIQQQTRVSAAGAAASDSDAGYFGGWFSRPGRVSPQNIV